MKMSIVMAFTVIILCSIYLLSVYAMSINFAQTLVLEEVVADLFYFGPFHLQ